MSSARPDSSSTASVSIPNGKQITVSDERAVRFARESLHPDAGHGVLADAGYVPRKKDWKIDHFAIDPPAPRQNSEGVVPEKAQRHSSFCYKYRFVEGNLQMIPRLHKSGLDFLLVVKPKT